MKLVSNWRAVLLRAWSIRLILLAGVLSGLETILPTVNDWSPWAVPPRLFAIASFVVTMTALYARVVAQKDVDC